MPSPESLTVQMAFFRVGVVALLALAIAPSAEAQQAPATQFTNVNYVNAPVGPDLNVPILREGNIKLGPLALHPSFGMAETYTDNVFRTS